MPFCSPGQPKPYVHSNLPNVNLDSRLVKDHQFSPSINPVKTQQYSTSIQEIMRAHQTLRDLPHVPVSPQQRYVLTEPTINHCDILRITAQLGVMGKLNPQEFHLGQEVFNLGDNCNTASSTANFIQDLIETKQVEVHFFERIKEPGLPTSSRAKGDPISYHDQILGY
jgi:hypothetical protein